MDYKATIADEFKGLAKRIWRRTNLATRRLMFKSNGLKFKSDAKVSDRIIDKKSEFSELVTQNHARLYAYIHSLLQNLHDADEVMQRTVLVLWNKFAAYDRSKSFFAWACGVGRFEAKNFLRQRNREMLSFSDQLAEMLVDSHIEQRAELQQQTELLNQCIEKLNHTDRSMMEQCYQDDRSVAQVAESLGRSTQSIYNSLRRIRNILHQCVSKSLQLE